LLSLYEKRQIVIAITETIRALEHVDRTTSPADMPVGFQKDRCPPRAAVFCFLPVARANIIFQLVISSTSKAREVVYDNHIVCRKRDNPTMTPQDVDRNDPRRFENACRDFWTAFVKIEIGECSVERNTLTKECIALAPKLNG